MGKVSLKVLETFLNCLFKKGCEPCAPLAPYFCCSLIEMLVFFLSHVHGMQYFTGSE